MFVVCCSISCCRLLCVNCYLLFVVRCVLCLFVVWCLLVLPALVVVFCVLFGRGLLCVVCCVLFVVHCLMS